jgi:hydroxymethylpyrimidine/phosphomethylpyrimidine kinase
MEVPPEFLAQQLDCVFSDIVPDAVKIGMLSSQTLMEIVVDRLTRYQARNIVVDPVMISTSGSRLLSEEAIDLLTSQLLPIATLVTPNVPEAEVLAGIPVKTAEDMVDAARIISQRYGCAVLCKGGHQTGEANDLLCQSGEFRWFNGQRIDNPNTHGTGCTLSAAIASNLSLGMPLHEAVFHAKEYISGAIGARLEMGKGNGPLWHGWSIVV